MVCFVEVVLVEAKKNDGNHMRGIEYAYKPMRQINIHPRGFIFFSLGEGNGWVRCKDGIILLFCSHNVPIVPLELF